MHSARYIGKDPIGLDGELIGFKYVDINPLQFSAPTGEAAVVAVPPTIAYLGAAVIAGGA